MKQSFETVAGLLLLVAAGYFASRAITRNFIVQTPATSGPLAGGAGWSVTPRSSWEPAKAPTGDTADYLAWVSEEYYGDSGDAIVLDARDARARAAKAAPGFNSVSPNFSFPNTSGALDF
jgi:hypothetical protein